MKTKIYTTVSTIMLFIPWGLLFLRRYDWALQMPMAKILISGCAHNGILNILDSFRNIYGTDPSIVISGFHMVQPEYTEDDLQKIKETAVELSKMDTVFYSGHCTGETAYQLLKEIMGEKLKAIRDL